MRPRSSGRRPARVKSMGPAARAARNVGSGSRYPLTSSSRRRARLVSVSGAATSSGHMLNQVLSLRPRPAGAAAAQADHRLGLLAAAHEAIRSAAHRKPIRSLSPSPGSPRRPERPRGESGQHRPGSSPSSTPPAANPVPRPLPSRCKNPAGIGMARTLSTGHRNSVIGVGRRIVRVEWGTGPGLVEIAGIVLSGACVDQLAAHFTSSHCVIFVISTKTVGEKRFDFSS